MTCFSVDSESNILLPRMLHFSVRQVNNIKGLEREREVEQSKEIVEERGGLRKKRMAHSPDGGA